MNEIEAAHWPEQLIAHGWPQPLIQAVNDDFFFRLRLKSGEIFDFNTAFVGESKEWIVIRKEDGFTGNLEGCERGVHIRVSEIVWCAVVGR